MPVILDRTTGYTQTEPELIDQGGIVGGAGSLQRVNRLGNRWALTVNLPPMRARDAMGWVTDLNMGMTQGVIARWGQPEFEIPPSGTPLVNGAGQSGSSLICDGFLGSAVMRKGQFFNVVIGGQHYLYQCAASTVASTGGAMTIPILPMLRVPPADNATIRLDPVIEGLLLGDGRKWSVDRSRTIGLQFTVMESQ